MKKEITVTTSSVYEPRALAELVGVANDFSSRVNIVMENRSINAKSIMGVMGIGLDMGKTIVIEAEGADESDAIAALEKFLTE